MNRRGFIGLIGAGVAGLALDAAIPFNRVWSFPKHIVAPLHPFDYQEHYIRAIEKYMEGINEIINEWNADRMFFVGSQRRVGSVIKVRMPQRWIVRDLLRTPSA